MNTRKMQRFSFALFPALLKPPLLYTESKNMTTLSRSISFWLSKMVTSRQNGAKHHGRVAFSSLVIGATLPLLLLLLLLCEVPAVSLPPSIVCHSDNHLDMLTSLNPGISGSMGQIAITSRSSLPMSAAAWIASSLSLKNAIRQYKHTRGTSKRTLNVASDLSSGNISFIESDLTRVKTMYVGVDTRFSRRPTLASQPAIKGVYNPHSRVRSFCRQYAKLLQRYRDISLTVARTPRRCQPFEVYLLKVDRPHRAEAHVIPRVDAHLHPFHITFLISIQ